MAMGRDQWREWPLTNVHVVLVADEELTIRDVVEWPTG